ncbi:hypothetical protein [Nocardioides sp. W7]|uniref:hypothetical protein n=1 Tax=Nocardioides sp. W7 TaxID=2931390 RepID=UPI001FD232D5|nr:hypothetical protein [Nocardioides sp. W7]
MEDPAHRLLELLAEELHTAEIPGWVLAPVGDAPAQLVVPLGDGDAGADPTVHVLFLPGHDDPAVLQYMVVLDHDVPLETVPVVARLLHLLNTNLVTTGFELGETFSSVVFRHVHAVAIDPLDPAVVAWTLTMVFHAVVHYDVLVAQACRGASYDELSIAFARIQADLFAPADLPG